MGLERPKLCGQDETYIVSSSTMTIQMGNFGGLNDMVSPYTFSWWGTSQIVSVVPLEKYFCKFGVSDMWKENVSTNTCPCFPS